ncbi:50S ribosomal protein L32e [Candidatus Woesearchaeota archaeon]|nr:50S ribosomal protein L32e [Candidatus Woesearchaeota archaeon]
MADMKSLLGKRRHIKKRKPEFILQDYGKKPRLKRKWRKPKGIDSKIRLGLRGYRKIVTKGYGSPKLVKGLHKSGLKPVLVISIKDIDSVNKEKEGIIIKGSIGLRKKVELVKKAKEKGIRILNLKDPDKFLKAVSESMEKKKQEKKKLAEKKEKKAKEVKEKAKPKEEKEELADKISDEEKKEAEKKERDKLLTQRT